MRFVKDQGYKKKTKKTKLTILLDPNAANGSLLDELGVGKLLVNALEFPETNPEELKLLKGSKAAYKINTKRKKNKRKGYCLKWKTYSGGLFAKCCKCILVVEQFISLRRGHGLVGERVIG